MRFRNTLSLPLVIICAFIFTSCKSNNEDEISIDYSNITFAEAFDVSPMALSSVTFCEGITMENITSKTVEGSYEGNLQVYIKPKYKMNITGVHYKSESSEGVIEAFTMIKVLDRTGYVLDVEENYETADKTEFEFTYTFDTTSISKSDIIMVNINAFKSHIGTYPFVNLYRLYDFSFMFEIIK